MTAVEYTETALNHLDGLDPQVADRVMNKIEETTEWTEHRLEPLPGYPYYSCGRLARDYYLGSGERPAHRRGRRPPAERL